MRRSLEGQRTLIGGLADQEHGIRKGVLRAELLIACLRDNDIPDPVGGYCSTTLWEDYLLCPLLLGFGSTLGDVHTTVIQRLASPSRIYCQG